MNKRQQQKQATREKIRTAAKQLFMAQGFEAATSRQIAAAAGVATGTLFVHFANKQAILADILYEDIEVRVAQAFAMLSPNEPTVDKLLTIARTLYSYYLQHPELSRVLLRDNLLSLNSQADFREQVERFLAQLTQVLRVGQQQQQDVVTTKAAQTMAHLFMAAYLFGLLGLLGEAEPDVEVALSALARMTQAIVS